MQPLDSKPYIVKPGDTLASIAKQFGFTNWTDIYNSPANSSLRKIYPNPNQLRVGEKIMIQMPTWFFPAGAGPYSEGSTFSTHGEPSPLATFRFAEPIFIDRQQNFRVEVEIPDSDVLKELQRIYGPFFIWVVLDGYMTRDVQ